MKRYIFDPCVSKVINLIHEQIQLVAITSRRRVKVRMPYLRSHVSILMLILQSVWLVGGYGESPYLQEELRKSLEIRRVKLQRPETKKS